MILIEIQNQEHTHAVSKRTAKDHRKKSRENFLKFNSKGGGVNLKNSLGKMCFFENRKVLQFGTVNFILIGRFFGDFIVILMIKSPKIV